jgi:hypothetical protein
MSDLRYLDVFALKRLLPVLWGEVVVVVVDLKLAVFMHLHVHLVMVVIVVLRDTTTKRLGIRRTTALNVPLEDMPPNRMTMLVWHPTLLRYIVKLIA